MRFPTLLVMVVVLGVGVSAHHSIAAVYDVNQSVTVEGVVIQFRFVNPHPYVVISGQEEGGTVQPWHLEMDNRGELAAAGMTAETIRPGDRVVVTGSRSRTVRQNLYIRKLVRQEDGFEYEQVGNSPRIRQR
jgi:NADPH:quinone reductase-like Zn-dependent oxidoreductase